MSGSREQTSNSGGGQLERVVEGGLPTFKRTAASRTLRPLARDSAHCRASRLKGLPPPSSRGVPHYPPALGGANPSPPSIQNTRVLSLMLWRKHNPPPPARVVLNLRQATRDGPARSAGEGGGRMPGLAQPSSQKTSVGGRPASHWPLMALGKNHQKPVLDRQSAAI